MKAMPTIEYPNRKPTLKEMREREARLEALIAEETQDMLLLSDNISRMADELSELKKKIGPLTLLSLAQV